MTDAAIVPDSIISPDSLPVLAETANREHLAFTDSAKSMVEHAVACGEALIEAKQLVRHGEWMPWVEANFDATHDTANNYMKVASNSERVRNLDEPSLRKALAAISGGNAGAHVGANTGENEWYTSPEIIEAVVLTMGGIDLDPASTPTANRIVQAETIYTKADNGLAQPWAGRVFMNPPYAQPLIDHFTSKLVDTYKSDSVTEACVLVNNASDTTWFTRLSIVASARCDAAGRGWFWHPDRKSAPLQGQVIWYFGGNALGFVEAFARIGVSGLWAGRYIS